jgi:antitoxin component HigA of HigAB toxin-antitoxin module
MNPELKKADQPNDSGAKTMQDIVPPVASTQPEKNSLSKLLSAEFEHAIPVKIFGQSNKDKENNPTNVKQSTQESDDNKDKQLEELLKDVNKEVKNTPDSNKKESLFKKIFFHNKKAKNQKELKTSVQEKPILAIILASVITSGLTASAVYAFTHGSNNNANNKTSPTPSKVGTSSTSSNAVQAAGGILVSPGDVTDLSSSINSKLSQYNDSQDFNGNDLSDKNLGL